jgi:hypothetical protein
MIGDRRRGQQEAFGLTYRYPLARVLAGRPLIVGKMRGDKPLIGGNPEA